MKKKEIERLTEYLDSECSDYDLTYDYEWIEDCEHYEVTIKRDDYSQYTKIVIFKYDSENDDLRIELSEGSFYTTREFDETVKYFWMLITPSLWPNQ